MNSHVEIALLAGPLDPIRAVVIVWAREQMGLELKQIAALPGMNVSLVTVYRQHRRWENWAAGLGAEPPLCLNLLLNKRKAPPGPVRSVVLRALAASTMSAPEIAAITGAPVPAVTHMMSRLTKAGLVRRMTPVQRDTRRGRPPYRYSLSERT